MILILVFQSIYGVVSDLICTLEGVDMKQNFMVIFVYAAKYERDKVKGRFLT
jgi:hypothetical protein